MINAVDMYKAVDAVEDKLNNNFPEAEEDRWITEGHFFFKVDIQMNIARIKVIFLGIEIWDSATDSRAWTKDNTRESFEQYFDKKAFHILEILFLASGHRG
jgi:hypothetical protein